MMGAGMLPVVGEAMDANEIVQGFRSGDMGRVGLGAASLAIPGLAAGSLRRIPNPIKAYHGSPHDFDKFDMSKIGTGEGAQAYGHGLYFAENEGVARSYRDNLADPGTLSSRHDIARLLPAKYAGGSDNANRIIKNIQEALAGGDIQKADEYLDVFDVAPEMEPAYRAAMEKLGQGRMYEAAIHADPDEFLDWDAPLSEQGEKVRGAVEPLREDYRLNEGAGPRPYLYDDQSGHLLYREVAKQLGAAPMGSPEAATANLRRLGIPGIKYLDGGSRQAGQGTRNYVVFDDSLIEILRKYGLAGVMAETLRRRQEESGPGQQGSVP